MTDLVWDDKERIVKSWYVQGKSILDVGCNDGTFSGRFKEAKTGIDYSPHELKKAKSKGIRTIKHDLNKPFNLRSKFYNIFCLDILEHLLNPVVCIKSCYKHLEQNGKFFISVPYFGLFKRALIALFFFDKIFGHKTLHIRFFSPNNIRQLLIDSGFKIVREYKLGRFFPVYMDLLFICEKGN